MAVDTFNTKYFGTITVTPGRDELELNGRVTINGKPENIFAVFTGLEVDYGKLPQMVPLLDKYLEAVEIAKAAIIADYDTGGETREVVNKNLGHIIKELKAFIGGKGAADVVDIHKLLDNAPPPSMGITVYDTDQPLLITFELFDEEELSITVWLNDSLKVININYI